MKEAYVISLDFDGNPKLAPVDLDNFKAPKGMAENRLVISLRTSGALELELVGPDLYQKVQEEGKICACKYCGRPVSIFNVGKDGSEPELEFRHPKIEDVGTCPQTFKEELKLEGLYLNNFDMKNIGPNREALKKVEEGNKAELKSLMEEWTGEAEISEKDAKEFERLTKIFISMEGLDKHPEAFPAILVTNLEKTRGKNCITGVKQVGFAWGGDEIKLAKKSKLPGSYIQLCWGADKFKPLWGHLEHTVTFSPTARETLRDSQTTFIRSSPEQT